MNKTICIIAGTLALTALSCENSLPGEMNPEEQTTIIANTASPEANSRTAIDPTYSLGARPAWLPDYKPDRTSRILGKLLIA